MREAAVVLVVVHLLPLVHAEDLKEWVQGLEYGVALLVQPLVDLLNARLAWTLLLRERATHSLFGGLLLAGVQQIFLIFFLFWACLSMRSCRFLLLT